MKSGFAEKEGSEKFFHLHPIHKDKIRKFNDISLSGIGIGTYLGDADTKTDEMYHKSILSSIQHGVNCIDTAINYRCQRSEKVIGEVLQELAELGIARNQLFISTKGGIIPPDEETENYDTHIQKHYIERHLINPKEIVADCHCLSPTFLEHEIHKSKSNLQLHTIDMYFLHNPELQLFEVTEEEFEERLFNAFQVLENAVKQGSIKHYGVSTWNGFRQKPNTKGLLQLRKIIKIAKEASGANKHHFKAIQLPYNLVMLEAKKMANQSKEEEKFSILHTAMEENIAVFASAPYMQGKVFHLPQRVFDQLPQEQSRQHQALQFVLSTKTITNVLVGMKNPMHVHENVKVLHKGNWTDEEWKATCSYLGIR